MVRVSAVALGGPWIAGLRALDPCAFHWPGKFIEETRKNKQRAAQALGFSTASDPAACQA